MRRLPRRTMGMKVRRSLGKVEPFRIEGNPGAMDHARPLPPDLLARYRAWQDRRTPEDIAAYAEAARKDQNPKAMIITCCDSRVLISEIFGNEPGDFFIHRNIANLVPPHEPDGRSHGTSAAIEYAVIALRIDHLIVMGHHGCGGVRGCHDMLAGLAPDLDTPTSFVGTWLKFSSPASRRSPAAASATRRGSRRSRRRRCWSACAT